MDIEEYLKKKKDLERKKDELERKEQEREEKDRVKKKVETHEHISQPSHPEEHHPAHISQSRSPRNNAQWIFLGGAFLLAVVVIGVYLIQYLTPDDNSEIKDLEKEIEELKEQLNAPDSDQKDNAGSKTVADNGNDSEDSPDGELEPAAGPDFDIYLKDDWVNENSIGIFDTEGRIGDNIIEIFGDTLYRYRLFLENKESSVILCKVDEEILIDQDSDGEVDDEKFKLDIHTLEFDQGDVEEIQDSIMAQGTVTGKYEARCYFCEDLDCESYYEPGEEVKSAKFKVIINSEPLNKTNSS